MSDRLQHRRILVTGASSGIGAAIARSLAAEGAQVALLARRVPDVHALADRIGAIAIPADVTDPEATRVAVDRAAQQLGGLDGLVNAAGVLRAGLVQGADPADWRLLFDVNVLGVLHATHAAIGHLRRSGRGDVINLSSMSGRRLASAEMGVYAASKAAVHMLSEGLRRELAPDRVRVTIVAPGLVDTPLFDGADDAYSANLGVRADEVGLSPEDVARTVADLIAAPPHVAHVEVAMLSVDQ